MENLNKMIDFIFNKWTKFYIYESIYLKIYNEWCIIWENIKILMEATHINNRILLNMYYHHHNNYITNGIRLRAGFDMVAVEKTKPIPYRSINVRRGNAMRFLLLDYIKEKPIRNNTHTLYVILSKDKRKAMENIAAEALFTQIDAYRPEERFYPLHVRPTGDTYYIAEKKIDQMAYVVNKFKKKSNESLYSEVTWNESEDFLEKKLNEIVDLKTNKLTENIDKFSRLIDEVEKYSFIDQSRYTARTSLKKVDSGKPYRSVYESTSCTTMQPKLRPGQYDYGLITRASEAIIRPRKDYSLPRCRSDDERCTCRNVNVKTKCGKKDRKKSTIDKKAKTQKKVNKFDAQFSKIINDKKRTKRKGRSSSSDTNKKTNKNDQYDHDQNFQVFNVTELRTMPTNIIPIEEVIKENRPSDKNYTNDKNLNFQVYNVAELGTTPPHIIPIKTINETHNLDNTHKNFVHRELKEKHTSKLPATTNASNLPTHSLKHRKHKISEILLDASNISPQSKNELANKLRKHSKRENLERMIDMPSELSKQSKNEKHKSISPINTDEKPLVKSITDSARHKHHLITLDNTPDVSNETPKQFRHRTKETKHITAPSDLSTPPKHKSINKATTFVQLENLKTSPISTDTISDTATTVTDKKFIKQQHSYDAYSSLIKIEPTTNVKLSPDVQINLLEDKTTKQTSNISSEKKESVKTSINQNRASILKIKGGRTEITEFVRPNEKNIKTKQKHCSSKHVDSLRTEKVYDIYRDDTSSTHDEQKEHTVQTRKKLSEMPNISTSLSTDRPKQKIINKNKKRPDKTVDLNLVKQKLEQLTFPNTSSNEDQKLSTDDSFLAVLIKAKLKEMNLQKAKRISPTQAPIRHRDSPPKTKLIEKDRRKIIDEKSSESTQQLSSNKTKSLESSPFFVQPVRNDSSTSHIIVSDETKHRIQQRDRDGDNTKKQDKPSYEYMSFSLYKTESTNSQTEISSEKIDFKMPASIASTSSDDKGNQFFLHKKVEKKNSKLALFNTLFKKKSREFQSSSKQSQDNMKPGKSTVSLIKLLKRTRKSKDNVTKDPKSKP